MTEASTARKRLRLGAGVLAGGSVLGLLLFVGANVVPVQVPEPLWTEADLPGSEVPEADNGWSVVMNLGRVEIPGPLAKLTAASEHDAERFWAQVRDHQHPLREFMDSPAARETLAGVEAARSRPAFSDTCTIGGQSSEAVKLSLHSPGSHSRPCPGQGSVFDWRAAHQVALLGAIERARTGDAAYSSMLLRDLVRMDTAHLHSARSLVSFLVALSNLQEALHSADMIAQHLGQGPLTPDANAALAELSQVVAAVDVEAINLEQLVIVWYLSDLALLEGLEGGDPDLRERLDIFDGSTPLYSHALTLRSVNERFEARHQGAVEHDTCAALGCGERSPKQQFGWWLRNPVGKLALDALMFETEDMAASIEEDLAQLSRTRAQLLARPVVLAATE